MQPERQPVQIALSLAPLIYDSATLRIHSHVAEGPPTQPYCPVHQKASAVGILSSTVAVHVYETSPRCRVSARREWRRRSCPRSVRRCPDPEGRRRPPSVWREVGDRWAADRERVASRRGGLGAARSEDADLQGFIRPERRLFGQCGIRISTFMEYRAGIARFIPPCMLAP